MFGPFCFRWTPTRLRTDLQTRSQDRHPLSIVVRAVSSTSSSTNFSRSGPKGTKWRVTAGCTCPCPTRVFFSLNCTPPQSDLCSRPSPFIPAASGKPVCPVCPVTAPPQIPTRPRFSSPSKPPPNTIWFHDTSHSAYLTRRSGDRIRVGELG